MSFDERYQLLDLAEDKGVKTFVAREISTGRKVTVFLFVGEQAHGQAELLDRLRTADRLQLPELIEVGDNRGTPYVVTQPLSGFSEFKDRVLRLNIPPPAPPEHKPGEFSKAGIWHVPSTLLSTPGQAEKASGEPLIAGKQQTMQADVPSGPGSYTQMFQAPAHPIDEPSIEVPKTAPAPPMTAPPEQSASGSFTQVFQAPAPPIGEPKTEVPKAPPPPVAPPPAQPAPGEFTQVFQAPASPIGEPKTEIPKAPPPPVAPPPAQHVPGEFTQMFQAPAPPIGEPKTEVPKVPLPPPVTPPPAKLAPGEFTRFFNAASSSSAAPSPMPQKPEAQGEFARIFGSGDRVTTPPSTVTGIFDQPSSTAALKQGQSEGPSAPTPPRAYTPPAGEFTKIFGETSLEIPTLGPMAQTPPPSAPTPPVGAPGAYTRMFGAQPLAQEPIAVPAPAPIGTPETPVPTKRTSKLVPVLIGVILLLLAAIAIIVVTMRK